MSEIKWQKGDGAKWTDLEFPAHGNHPSCARGIVHELYEDGTLRALLWYARGWGWYCVQFCDAGPVLRPLGTVREVTAKSRVARQVIERLKPTLEAYGEKPWRQS